MTGVPATWDRIQNGGLPEGFGLVPGRGSPRRVRDATTTRPSATEGTHRCPWNLPVIQTQLHANPAPAVGNA